MSIYRFPDKCQSLISAAALNQAFTVLEKAVTIVCWNRFLILFSGPILRRSALPKDTKTSPQINGSPESQRQAVNTSPGSSKQPRSRRKQLTGML